MRDNSLILMLYGTGARISEVLKLKVGDIQPQNGKTRILVLGKTGQHLDFVSEEAFPTLRNG
ncbi:MAG: tyrosine-type recombinase/integrase [Candidatus Thorarchaeota archaeon]